VVLISLSVKTHKERFPSYHCCCLFLRTWCWKDT